VLTPADIDYITSEFVPLADTCAAAGRDLAEVRSLIERRELPAPPYPGPEYVPANYFTLPGPDDFADAPEEREPYLDGTYFVCLRDATVANIVRKGRLVDQIRVLLAEPQAASPRWLAELEAAVDELDLLERPFSPDYDRVRFGRPPTRDELIRDVRTRYFGAARSAA
jgi:hypothetical protein